MSTNKGLNLQGKPQQQRFNTNAQQFTPNPAGTASISQLFSFIPATLVHSLLFLNLWNLDHGGRYKSMKKTTIELMTVDARTCYYDHFYICDFENL